MLLVPCDVLNPRRADEHFAAEAASAPAVALVDHDALARGEAERAVARVVTPGEAVYRGWMLTSDAYAGFATALAGRGVTLRTSASQYRRAHELPGWYDALREFTPATVWTRGSERPDFERALAGIGSGAAVLRDYTKSMKHHWHEAAYVPDVTDTAAAWAVAARFLELRGDDFTGGFVLRRFETFTGAEARTWWVGGACRLVTAHPDTPDDLPPADPSPADPSPADLLPAGLESAVAALGLPFVTVDLARHTDGRRRVVELGDGQVSDRPSSTPADAFLSALD